MKHFAALLLVAVLVGCPSESITKDTGKDTPDVSDEKDLKPLPPGACPPGAVLGCTSIDEKKVCNKKGDAFVVEKCGNGELCFGQGVCKSAICQPGEKKCLGPTFVGQCQEDGSDYALLEECSLGLVCDPAEGKCISSCSTGTKALSNVGCAYALVDLGNYESDPANKVDDRPVLVVVSNTSGDSEAHLAIKSYETGIDLAFSAEELTIASQGLKTFLLPTGKSQLTTSVNNWSWQLTSDQPVTVHLFNPENGPDVRSNDASLLFPTDALGTDYVVMGWKSFYNAARGFDERGYPKYGFPSYITVVAVAPGTTHVAIRPTENIRPGFDNGVNKGPIPRIEAGAQAVHKIQQWDVLNYTIEPQLAQMDLTGTTVQSDKPVAVFSAHNCAFVPSIEVKYCDHLEHQLAPVNTWGKTYVADLFHPRAPNAYDVWRVMAAEDQTVVTTNPPVEGATSKILNKGEWFEYQASFPHLISATNRIQVGHFMTGSNMDGFDLVCGNALTGIGDPVFTIGVALNQFLDNYVVLTPPGYSDDYLNIVRKVDTMVLLDGVAVDQEAEAIGDTGLELVRLVVADGVHRLESTELFGVTAYGYDCDVSYAYPGGMSLSTTSN